jgi:F-type H+-transporting ATPase subunit b
MDLTLDPATIVFQAINFLVLAAVLYRFLWKPMLERIRQRADRIETMRGEIETDREEAARMTAELEARLERADEEADRIVTDAQEEAEAARQEILKETEGEVERILAEAHTEAQRVRKQAAEEFEEQALDAVLEVSAQLIGSAAPPELHDTLIQQLSDRIWEMGRTEMQRVEDFRRSLGERAPTAQVTTARPLSPEQQGLFARTFTALADRHVNVEVQVDSSLAAGARVRVGDLLIDNSIAGQLEELRHDTVEALSERVSHE